MGETYRSLEAEVVNGYRPPEIEGDFKGKHIISVDQFERKDVESLFKTTENLKNLGRKKLAKVGARRLLATLFYEPSTRTDCSFQAAIKVLGGEVVRASNGMQYSSVSKGENLEDTVRTMACYSDLIVLRSPIEGSALNAARALNGLWQETGISAVLINAGDGIGEHPTQALLDLYTIYEQKQTIDELNITMVGDLKNGRTVHSLAKLICRVTQCNSLLFKFVSPESLKMTPEVLSELDRANVNYEETEDVSEVIGESDVIYWTRIQEERFENTEEFEAVKDYFIMTPELYKQASTGAILMHPFPRKHEMGTEADHRVLDSDKRSVYWQQMENGKWVRMALLAEVMGRTNKLNMRA